MYQFRKERFRIASQRTEFLSEVRLISVTNLGGKSETRLNGLNSTEWNFWAKFVNYKIMSNNVTLK